MALIKIDLQAGKPTGNRKVMIYVAPNVHRALERVAFDEGRSTSSVYVDAAYAFLEARGIQVGGDDTVLTPAPPSRPATEMLEAIERQGRRIEELHAAIEGIQGGGPRPGPGPAGTKAAEAMKVMLGILKAAGAAGMTTRELTEAACAAGLKSGAAETAKAVLVGAGIVRCDRKRCRLHDD